MTLQEIVSLVLIAIGSSFMLIAGIGILRMPDLFLRMSMTTKAATLGVGFILLGSIVFFIDDVGVAARLTATLIFLMLTAPISAHMIGRAGYIDKDTELWDGTVFNELDGHYDLASHTLSSITEDSFVPTVDIKQLERDAPERITRALNARESKRDQSENE